MKKRVVLLIIPILLFSFCAREAQRADRYNPNDCPFCLPDDGACTYCDNTAKCHFCNGTGTRETVVPNLPEKGIESITYEDTCQYCGGDGVCQYCNGAAQCWACDGKGTVEDWGFYEKHLLELQNLAKHKD